MATPFKMKGSPYPKRSDVKITYNADGSVTRSKGGKTVTMEPNPDFDPKSGKPSDQSKSKMRVRKKQGKTLNQVINQNKTKMTYLYYKTSSTSNIKPNEKTINQWKHLAEKKNWRITQLPNGFYQTECLNPDIEDQWQDVTRRETIEGAETAINGSVTHFQSKLEATKGPKVVKTFE